MIASFNKGMLKFKERIGIRNNTSDNEFKNFVRFSIISKLDDMPLTQIQVDAIKKLLGYQT